MYKLSGQVRKNCTKNGHWIIRIVDDKIHDKLMMIDKRTLANIIDTGMTSGGLIKPIFDEDEDKKVQPKTDEIRRPYTDDEFVVKIPKRLRGSLPDIGTFVSIMVKSKFYKFEKNNHKYIGWSIVLSKLSIDTYTYEDD